MTAATDKLKSHFKGLVGDEKPTFNFQDVDPSYPDIQVTVFPITLAKRDRIIKMQEEKGINHALAQRLIEQCRDENGNAIFGSLDIKALTESCDPDLIQNIAIHLGTFDPSYKKIEEELGKTET